MLPMSVILPESHDRTALERSAAYLQTELAISQRRYRLLEDDFIDLKERSDSYEKRCHDLEEQLRRTYQLCKLQEFQKEKAVAYCSDLWTAWLQLQSLISVNPADIIGPNTQDLEGPSN